MKLLKEILEKIIFLIGAFVITALIIAYSPNFIGSISFIIFIILAYNVIKKMYTSSIKPLFKKNNITSNNENKDNLSTNNNISPSNDNIHEDKKNNNLSTEYIYEDEFVNEYISLDVETTGFNALKDDLIEVAGVHIKDGRIIETFNELVKPSKSIPNKIIYLTGIDNEMVKNSRNPEEVLDDFIEFIGNLPLLGHNITFDLRFLRANTLKDINNTLVDTMKISRKINNFDNHKLKTLIKAYSIDIQQEHRALSDCVATYQIYELMKDQPNL